MASKYILPCFRFKSGRIAKKEKDNELLTYRNELVEALDRTKGKLEASWKALESIVSKPDYQRHIDQLFDVLYTGGLLTNEGKFSNRGDLKLRTSYCVFKTHDELNALRVYEQLIKRLRRRYKHLDAAFESHAQRLLTLLGGFEVEARRRLALLMTLFLIDGQLNPRLLLALGQQQSNIDEGLALEFMLIVCVTLKRERGGNFMLQIFKKSGLDGKIISYMPPMLRSDLYFRQVYQENDLNEIIKLHETRAGQELRRQLQQRLLDDFREKLPQVDVVMNVRQFQRHHHMSDSEVIAIVWHTIIFSHSPNFSASTTSARSNFSSPLNSSLERILRKLQIYSPLLNGICSTDSAQIALLMQLQEWCYEHHSFLNHFERLTVHLYKAGVINEDAIIRWYEVDHIDKGKVAFLDQMRCFVHWLHSDRDASSRVDYNTYLANRQQTQYRSQPVYSDVVTTRHNTKTTIYVKHS
ncbi:protein krasavietz-like [Drosophila innubila]|uniref:protein krasavietz-like n=1 Tax=Drosophila innubila TaxID=198719 RepID=UPI00148B5FAF|nr:protein krasavietz-like [Drosophila innubila]